MSDNLEMPKTFAELEDYTSRILASQQAAHDAEIARLKENFDGLKNVLHDTQKELSAANATIALAKEKITAMAESCPHTEYDPDCTATGNADDAYNHGSDMARSAIGEQLRELLAISASPQQVAEWERKQLEPLRAQVAMLHKLVAKAKESSTFLRPLIGDDYEEMCDALTNTQATAEQFIAECEQRGAVKALEDAINHIMSGRVNSANGFQIIENLRRRLESIRANSKKAG